VWSEHKRIEKLRYIHRNPVKRGLVQEPEQSAWSSYRSYAYGEARVVNINAWGASKCGRKAKLHESISPHLCIKQNRKGGPPATP